MKRWYNGYSFLGEPVYNPFDILLYLDNREFRPYWFETGTSRRSACHRPFSSCSRSRARAFISTVKN